MLNGSCGDGGLQVNSRDQWRESNIPRAILYAVVKNENGKTLHLCKKNEEGQEVCRLPHVICSNRSEPINQIISGLHAQTGIWADPSEPKYTRMEKTDFDQEEFEVPSYEIEMTYQKVENEKEPKVWLAKGFSSYKWMKK